jgi:ubiquinone/menaquinone biosynthesis C-methylase UbiE
MGPSADQLPEGWSDGAEGYDAQFAGFTGLYADDALDRLGVGAGTTLLDVAGGTGATSLEAASRGATVICTDFAPGMVAVAARRLAQRGHADATTALMDGQALELEDDSVDAAVSMFGLMFFPDPGRGVAEMRRVVRSGGGVALGTWDLEGFGMHRLIGAALEVAAPGIGDSPRPTPTWAPLGTTEGLHELMDRAGLVDVSVERVVRAWHFVDPAGFFASMPSWSTPVKPLFDLLPADRIAAAAAAFGEHVAEQGGLPGGDGIEMTALVGVARVP